MKKNHSAVFQGLLDFIFPRLCLGCKQYLSPNERGLCTPCFVAMPFTDHFKQAQNVLQQELVSHLPIQHAAALSYFQKEGLVAELVHQLKYKNQPKVGHYLGRWMGAALQTSPYFKPLDGIIPVPLHPKRKRERGYNQTELIAKALGDVIQKPLCSEFLARAVYTPPLALANQGNRWKIIKNAFVPQDAIRGQTGHFLLVDDVVTTGATLTACAQALLLHSKIKLSIAVVGYRF